MSPKIALDPQAVKAEMQRQQELRDFNTAYIVFDDGSEGRPLPLPIGSPGQYTPAELQQVAENAIGNAKTNMMFQMLMAMSVQNPDDKTPRSPVRVEWRAAGVTVTL